MADQSAHAVVEDAERYLAAITARADLYPTLVEQLGVLVGGYMGRTVAAFVTVDQIHQKLAAQGVETTPTPAELRPKYATFLRAVADAIEAG